MARGAISARDHTQDLSNRCDLIPPTTELSTVLLCLYVLRPARHSSAGFYRVTLGLCLPRIWAARMEVIGPWRNHMEALVIAAHR